MSIQGVDVKQNNMTYLSYQEVLETFPQAAYYRWSPTIVGILYHTQLLKGKKSRKESCNLIAKQSAERLIQFIGQRFDNIAKK